MVGKFFVLAWAFAAILTTRGACYAVDDLVFTLANKTKGTLDRKAWAAVPDFLCEWPVL